MRNAVIFINYLTQNERSAICKCEALKLFFFNTDEDGVSHLLCYD